MSKFFISCDEATTICDKNQYSEASFIEKLKLSIHFILCKHCKKYSAQNTLLSTIFGDYAKKQCAKYHSLSSEDKQELEENIQKKL